MVLPPTAVITIRTILQRGPQTFDGLMEQMTRLGWAGADPSEVEAMLAVLSEVTKSGDSFSWGAARPLVAPATGGSRRRPAGDRPPSRSQGAASAPPRPRKADWTLAELQLDGDLVRQIRRALGPRALIGLTCPSCHDVYNQNGACLCRR